MTDIKKNTDISEAGQEPSFADMFHASLRKEVTVRPGDRVEARVISVSGDSVFLDLGTRAEGVVAREEFAREGRADLKEGDTVTVLVNGFRDGMFRCTRRLGAGPGSPAAGKDSAALAKLNDAFLAGIPVEGKVKAVNKGGFDVVVLGQRAFCPISQIEKGFCTDPSLHLDKTYAFLIRQYEEGGRNIVLGRKDLLRAEEQERARRIWQELEVGQVLPGTVTSLTDYGAFVDIGGIEGLLHVSEISHQRVNNPREALQVGQELQVAVIALDQEKRKISLSLKAQQPDPWQELPQKLAGGGEFPGQVVRLRPFGAFVEIFPGVVGLLHVSRLGQGRRIAHPKEVLTVGDTVSVRVISLDLEQKTIQLTMEEPEQDVGADLAELKRSQGRDGSGTMAALLDSALERKGD